MGVHVRLVGSEGEHIEPLRDGQEDLAVVDEVVVARLAGGAGRPEVGVTGVQLSSEVSGEGAAGERVGLDAQVL